jgi:hypothetical protein
VANACTPPEDSGKADLPMTFLCPRFMLFSPEMETAAHDDTEFYNWGNSVEPPFVYGVVGHDTDTSGLDQGLQSTCCQCYQLVFTYPEPGSPQPPALPIPRPMIVQSFNTAAGGPNNFDIFMGAGGYGAFNACFDDPSFGGTSHFGHFMYDGFPNQYPNQGGIKPMNLEECKHNGGVTMEKLSSPACQDKIEALCNQAQVAQSSRVTETTRQSCIRSNQATSFYHQNWQVLAKRVECPENLTRVTGCRLVPSGLPEPDPNVRTAADADTTWGGGYTTTTMQDCCKPSCAWADWVDGRGLNPEGAWGSFYSCDINGEPITE